MRWRSVPFLVLLLKTNIFPVFSSPLSLSDPSSSSSSSELDSGETCLERLAFLAGRRTSSSLDSLGAVALRFVATAFTGLRLLLVVAAGTVALRLVFGVTEVPDLRLVLVVVEGVALRLVPVLLGVVGVVVVLPLRGVALGAADLPAIVGVGKASDVLLAGVVPRLRNIRRW